MIKTDQNIVNAINFYLRDSKQSTYDLAKITGVTPAAIVRWRKVGSGISPICWQKLFPLVKRYLPQNRIVTVNNGDEIYCSLEGEIKHSPAVSIPLFTAEQLLDFPAMISSVEQYANNIDAARVQYVLRDLSQKDVFAIDISTPCGNIPAGARIFATNSTRPSAGKLTLGVTAQDRKCVLDVFQADATHVALGECSAPINRAQLYFSVLCPVIGYEVVL